MRLSRLCAAILPAVLGLLPACTSPARPDAAAAAPAKKHPNILVILADDMGWRDWSGGGSRFYRTPHIDALAARGMRFDQAYAPAAICSPSRAALLTGRTPARLHLTDWIAGEGTPTWRSQYRVPDWTQRLPAVPTLPGQLQGAGYDTAIIGKWHLGDVAPRERGFGFSLAGGETGHPASYFWPYGAASDPHRVPDLAERGGKEGEYLTDRLTDEAIAWLRGHARARPGQPFMLELSHYAVHIPLEARADDLAVVAGWTPDGRQDNRAYAAMVHALDRSVGRMLQALRELGLERDTIVVFTSDNGGLDRPAMHPTSNAPLRAGKGYAFEGGTRVPLIVSGVAGMSSGAHSDAPVSGTDLMPTLLELAGVPYVAGLDGLSLAGALHGTPQPARVLGWHYPHYWGDRDVAPWSSLRGGALKVIHFYEDDRWALYDLASDPGETHDLAR
jgi:arylsulfatase A-like enzyme